MELGRCEVSACGARASVTHLGRGVCEQHWNQLTAEETPAEVLRKALGIEVPAVLPMEETMTVPTTSTKTRKRSGKPRPAGEPKVPKEPRPKKEKAPCEPQVVFAFRLSKPDRDRIHNAAGSGKATQFVTAAALAAADGDAKAFDHLAAQAKANRK